MNRPAITIYTTAWCGYCRRAKALLVGKNLAFEEIDVEADARFREKMVARSGRSSVPQIFIGDTHVGGCDDLVALERDGGLERLLGTAADDTRRADERG
jgi:glutaredoxin 3